jgi:hypothetical protein
MSRTVIFNGLLIAVFSFVLAFAAAPAQGG